MFRRYLCLFLFSLMLATAGFGQVKQKQPQPLPSPTPNEEDDRVKVFTEEVRLPVIAVDQFGHYDPTVVPDDILVLEDGVAQQIKSVRRIPANVILVLDTGGELSGLGGLSKRTGLTRDVAIELLNRLREDIWVEVMQFNNSVDVLQTWTRDRPATIKALKTKLSSGKRAHFADAVAAAAQQLKDRPEGSRHVVFITDGVDTPGGRVPLAQAMKEMAAARATIHIVSYTEFVRQEKPKKTGSDPIRQVPTSHDPITTMDPTLPPGTTRSPAYVLHSVTFDPAMRKKQKAYEAEVRNSQQVLTEVAEETGGQIFLPKTSGEMIVQAREAAREVGAEYVVTYRPRRPLSSAEKGQYRRIEVASRRVGLSLRSRRGYVVPIQP
ncbi:MAG: VWA domain-containing protein [Pyrinomonadaceae bacterium]